MTSAKRKEGKSKDVSLTKKLKKEYSEAEAPKKRKKKSEQSIPGAEKPKKKAKEAKQEDTKAPRVPSEDQAANNKAKISRHAEDAKIAPKPKKRKQEAAVEMAASTEDANAIKAAVEMEDGTVAGLTSKRSGKKRRRKTKADEEASLPAEEQQRRQRQRELRDLALNLRAGGKKYIRPKKRLATEAGKVEASKGQAAKPPAKSLDEQPFAGKEETGSRPTGPIQIIVVPIYWNRKPEEKAVVITAAEQLVDLIAAAGVKVGMDTTNALSPGQKFAHWEGKGVKVRVELGPRDAAKGEGVLAVVTTPGQLAQKQTLKVGPALLQAATKALGVDLTAAAVELAPSSLPAQTARQSKASEGGSQPSKMAVDAQPTTGAKHTLLLSGDDLGGDFADLTFDGEENAGRKKKSKR